MVLPYRGRMSCTPLDASALNLDYKMDNTYFIWSGEDPIPKQNGCKNLKLMHDIYDFTLFNFLKDMSM
jgi:hypothetical protein